MGWDTVDPVDPVDLQFKDSLKKRAKARSGHPLSENTWEVYGDHTLGDSYASYEVSQAPDYRYSCSCQKHRGGQYRAMCSHILFVIYARKGTVHFTRPLDSDARVNHSAPVGTPLSVPAYVEGSGASEREAREALDKEFNLWTNDPLPSWIKYLRREQWVAIEEIVNHYEEGKKVVFLDAPTGAGKTIIGEAVRRKVAPKKAMYTCSTKTLQDQFLNDFPYAKVIKGRSNYPTLDQPEKWPILSALACNKKKDEITGQNRCDHCNPAFLCPYTQAREHAMKATLAVANIAYLLASANYQDLFSRSPLTIVDEADVLEQELMRFIEFNMSPGAMKRYGLKQPDKKTVQSSWVSWIRKKAYPKLASRFDMIEHLEDPRSVREKRTLGSQINKLKRLGGWDFKEKGWGETDGLDGWVYTGYERGSVTFKPVRVDEEAQNLLWRHAKKWLLMSATIISAQQMAQDLGLEDDEWAVVTVDSNFPVEQRPIYVQPVANMTFKEKDKAWPKMAKTISKIAAHHSDERILVHTVSYQLADYLGKEVNDGRFYTYRNANEREEALSAWLQSYNGIMYAPSFDRGIDLADDKCRVVVVAKVPYPNLKDKQISNRLYSKGGQGWYSMLTVRSMVQMTGRAMRSKDDSCEIYLLDGQFMSNIWRKSRRMLPKWWSEALNMGGMPRDRR